MFYVAHINIIRLSFYYLILHNNKVNLNNSCRLQISFALFFYILHYLMVTYNPFEILFCIIYFLQSVSIIVNNEVTVSVAKLTW